jgi:hypothetical protein
MAQTQQLVELLKPDNQELLDFSGAWYAEIAADVQDFSDPMWVFIPDFDKELVWGPCVWQSRDSQALPQQGDLALAIMDNRRNIWVPAWWPFTDNTSSTVRAPNPSSKYPPPTTPPAGGILKSVGGHPVEQRPQSGTGKGHGANVPVTTSVKRGVLHDTEGAGDYQGQIDFMAANYFPHFAIGVDNGQPRVTQFVPLGMSADATAAHDFEIWCQIEIISPSGSAVGYSAGDWRTWLKPISDMLQSLMGSVGVPMTYRGAPANRGQNWAQAGWFGHNDVPDNDHADPGTGFPWGDYL